MNTIERTIKVKGSNQIFRFKLDIDKLKWAGHDIAYKKIKSGFNSSTFIVTVTGDDLDLRYIEGYLLLKYGF